MAENEMKNIDNVSQPKEYGHLTSQFNLDGVDEAVDYRRPAPEYRALQKTKI